MPDYSQRRVFVVLNVVAAIAFAVLFYFVHEQGQTIQRERRAAVIRACQDTNERHRNTIRTLDQRIAKLPPKQRAQAMNGRDFTVQLINALAPLQDCEKLADRVVPTG